MKPEPAKPEGHTPAVAPAAATPAPPKPPVNATTEDVIDPNRLTPEEQLARFEQALKETDWGHQPC